MVPIPCGVRHPIVRRSRLQDPRSAESPLCSVFGNGSKASMPPAVQDSPKVSAHAVGRPDPDVLVMVSRNSTDFQFQKDTMKMKINRMLIIIVVASVALTIVRTCISRSDGYKRSAVSIAGSTARFDASLGAITESSSYIEGNHCIVRFTHNNFVHSMFRVNLTNGDCVRLK
jgi:hypothetical protein